MFRNKTVFVLGAGASKPYGYPIGRELIDDIIDNIERDKIFLPQRHGQSRSYFYNENSETKETNRYLFSTDFEAHFKLITLESIDDIAPRALIIFSFLFIERKVLIFILLS